MKAHRYISIFLTLCFSVFLGHNLVPHHHHSEQVIVPLSSQCPVDHGDTEEHHHDDDHVPIHCHAFNDVVFDKYNSIQLREVSSHIHNLAIPSFIASVAPVSKENSSTYLLIKIPDKISDYYGGLSLRGPPALV